MGNHHSSRGVESSTSEDLSLKRLLQRSRVNYSFGDYEKAIEELCGLPPHWLRKPSIASAIASIRIKQGFYAEAAKALQVVEAEKSLATDDEGLLLVHVQHLYLSIIMEGNMQNATQRSMEIWKQYIESRNTSSLTDTMTVVGYYCLEIHRSAEEVGATFKDYISLLLPQNLLFIIKSLVEIDRIFEALELSEYSMLNALDFFHIFRELPTLRGRPEEVDVILRIANQYGEKKDYIETKKWLRQAKMHAKKLKYKKGLNEEKFLHILHPPTKDTIQQLLSLARIIEDAGDFLTAFRVLERARVMHTEKTLKSFSTGEKIINEMIRLAEKVGDQQSSMTVQFRRSDLLDAYHHFSESVKTRGKLLDSEWCKCFPYLAQYHQRQTRDYLFLGNPDKSLYHAMAYVEYCDKYKDPLSLSQSQTLLADAELSVLREPAEKTLHRLIELQSSLTDQIEIDSRQGFVKCEIDKLLMLAELEHRLGPLLNRDEDETNDVIGDIFTKAEGALTKLPPERKLCMRLEILFLRAVLEPQSLDADINNEFESLSSMVGSEAEIISDDEVTWQNWRLYQQRYRFMQAVKSESMGKILEVLEDAKRVEKDPEHQSLYHCYLFLGWVYYYATIVGEEMESSCQWKSAGITSRTQGLRMALGYFERAVKIKEELRAQLPLEITLDALRARQGLLEKEPYEVEMALLICYEMDEPRLTWLWVQRAKAQGFSSLMTGKSVNQAKENLRPDQLTRLYGVKPATYEDLRWMAQAEYERVVFVDWAPPIGADSSYILLTVHFEGADYDLARTRSAELAITPQFVDDWKSRYLNPAHLKDKTSNLYLEKLVGLVNVLEEYTQENDILVLSPTASLYNVPLHALPINNKPLLERNPVVYCHSLSVLRQCLERNEAPHEGLSRDMNWSAKFTAAYQESDQEEWEEITRSVTMMAAWFDSKPVIGSDLDTTSLQGMGDSNLFHFHGHCIFDSHNILEQRLILGNSQSNESSANFTSPDEFAIPAILELSLIRSPHVTLIACESGVQDISPKGDEPLGIIPAFLLAGAASVMGTLWTVKSEDGRRFSERFYDFFKKGPDTARSRGPVINLACAMQYAAKCIKEDQKTSAPYHWAGFVLWGAWFCLSQPCSFQGLE